MRQRDRETERQRDRERQSPANNCPWRRWRRCSPLASEWPSPRPQTRRLSHPLLLSGSSSRSRPHRRGSGRPPKRPR
eukprot:2082425-Heterocapsa_arctica.AAC.2